MRFRVLVVFILIIAALAQDLPKQEPQAQPKSVTVPIKLDHNRLTIEVALTLPNGTTQRVHAWVDNGNPNFYMSRRLAELTGSLSCDGQLCSATPPVEMIIGGLTIPLDGRIPGSRLKEATVSTGRTAISPGLDAEINIPSTVLRNYDVLINFPDRQLTIARPGSLKFNGVKTKAIVNPENGLIQVPSKIENKTYNLGLCLGLPFSFLSPELFEKLASAHPEWPHMTGAVGPANLSGGSDEPNWKLMRLDRLQYGPLFLTNVAVAEFPKNGIPPFEKSVGTSAGLLGANTLLNYRIGLDYAHSTVYFDIGRTFNFPDFDVVGLILRPEDDGRFTILGTADFDGKPSLPQGAQGIQPGDHLVAVDGIAVSNSTMGQVWSLLQGSPGQERELTIERARKQFTVVAQVRHFLGEAPADDDSQRKSKR